MPLGPTVHSSPSVFRFLGLEAQQAYSVYIRGSIALITMFQQLINHQMHGNILWLFNNFIQNIWFTILSWGNASKCIVVPSWRRNTWRFSEPWHQTAGMPSGENARNGTSAWTAGRWPVCLPLTSTDSCKRRIVRNGLRVSLCDYLQNGSGRDPQIW